MAITRAVASSITQGLPKTKSALAGNSTILPGSYESIQTVTVGVGGSSSDITFTSIPQTYKHLQLRFIARNNGTPAFNPALQFNNDTATNYSAHFLTGDGATVSSVAITNDVGIIVPILRVSSTTFTAYILDILDYADTNKNKTTRMLSGDERNGTADLGLFSGLWRSTAAITSIKIKLSSNTIAQYSSFALYGIL